MNNDLQPLKNRLRWLNRSILVLGIVILLGVIVWAVSGLRGPGSGTRSTVVHPASSASNVATRAASAVAMAQPKPALSTAQQERTAAAAMNALSSASAPASAAATRSSAPAVPGKASSQAAAAAASAPAVQAAAPGAPASAAVPAPAAAPGPKAAERKSTAPARMAQASSSSARHRQAGEVGVCHAAGWYVQVGAFGKQQSIGRLARKLHGAGYTRVCVAARDVRGLRLFYVGPYRNAAAARAARDPLRKLTGTEGILRKLP